MKDDTFIRTFRCGCTGRPEDVHAPDCPYLTNTGELEAFRELEAAARAWLADFDNRYDGEGLPRTRR